MKGKDVIIGEGGKIVAETIRTEENELLNYNFRIGGELAKSFSDMEESLLKGIVRDILRKEPEPDDFKLLERRYRELAIRIQTILQWYLYRRSRA